MQLASFSMAEVTYATGDISYLVQEQAKTASFRVKASQENVSGVVLPTFEVERVGASGAYSMKQAALDLTKRKPTQISTSPAWDEGVNRLQRPERFMPKPWRHLLSLLRSKLPS